MKNPSLQAAVVTGLNLLNDPDVRVPAAQAEGVAALRMLLQALASGQLVVQEPAAAQSSPTVAVDANPAPAPAVRKVRVSRKSKLNGADSAAPPPVQ